MKDNHTSRSNLLTFHEREGDETTRLEKEHLEDEEGHRRARALISKML